jgi:hypothetical protein
MGDPKQGLLNNISVPELMFLYIVDQSPGGQIAGVVKVPFEQRAAILERNGCDKRMVWDGRSGLVVVLLFLFLVPVVVIKKRGA